MSTVDNLAIMQVDIYNILDDSQDIKDHDAKPREYEEINNFIQHLFIKIKIENKIKIIKVL